MPLSKLPSPAVTVCGACPTFVQVTVPAAATTTVNARNSTSAASTATASGASAVVSLLPEGDGVVDGTGVAAGTGDRLGEVDGTAAGAPPAATTVTVPCMS